MKNLLIIAILASTLASCSKTSPQDYELTYNDETKDTITVYLYHLGDSVPKHAFLMEGCLYQLTHESGHTKRLAHGVRTFKPL